MIKRVISAFLSLALILSLCSCDGNSSKYKEAMAAYEEGDYQSAEELFESLEDYEDSTEMVLVCRYAQAEELYDAGDYEAAINIFETISDYSDSAKRIVDAKANLVLPELLEMITALNDAIEERNISECYSLIDKLEAVPSELDGEVFEIVNEAFLLDDGTSFFDSLESQREVLQSICINNTTIVIPAYVITAENSGSTLVNDHGDFAAYNVYFRSSSACISAFEEYKEYISQYATISDETSDSYLAIDASGNEIIVRYDIESSFSLLQVRVPRF